MRRPTADQIRSDAIAWPDDLNHPERAVRRTRPLSAPPDPAPEAPGAVLTDPSPEFYAIWQRMHERDAHEAGADAMERRYEEAQRQAERDAEERARRQVIERRTEIEFAIDAEIRRVVSERGGTYETTHDVALAIANAATRLGYEYDRIEVADLLAADPRPTHPLG